MVLGGMVDPAANAPVSTGASTGTAVPALAVQVSAAPVVPEGLMEPAANVLGTGTAVPASAVQVPAVPMMLAGTAAPAASPTAATAPAGPELVETVPAAPAGTAGTAAAAKAPEATARIPTEERQRDDRDCDQTEGRTVIVRTIAS
jgi:hypothetical protein